MNPLFALFQVADPCSASTSFVPCDKRPNDTVLPKGAHGLLVSFIDPPRRVQLWPVDLVQG